ncbi:hypothetical protein EVAR_21827_1 [Eumeta japonica]|uniref:Uncharacterized protein n=1 Tax=Eumeta variegata TaxID=151549 RepID=A0A4C1V7G1_EUMVA|nr:hypothetical protein EVAR_21827_1 [Eumeta japonica]
MHPRLEFGIFCTESIRDSCCFTATVKPVAKYLYTFSKYDVIAFPRLCRTARFAFGTAAIIVRNIRMTAFPWIVRTPRSRYKTRCLPARLRIMGILGVKLALCRRLMTSHHRK